MSSISSHARRHATYDAANPSPSTLAARRLASPSVSPFTAPPVTLLVGGLASPGKETKPVPFYVHEDVLTKISPFFRAAFELESQAAFSEGVSRTMKLPEDRPEDFAYLLQWVYWQLSNSPCGTHASDPYPALISLQDTHTSVLSLWHPSIDIPLSHYQAYKAMKQADKVIAAAAEKLTDSPPYLSSVDANDWQFGLALQPNIQAPQAQRTLAYETAKDSTQSPNEGIQPPSPQKPKLVRPPPPIFGPLIRLYILADKYALPTSLKRDLCARVRDVGREGKCVPDADDIAMLWEGIFEDASGKSEREGNQTSLKETVLEMYEALSNRSFRGLFYPSSIAPTTSTGAEATEKRAQSSTQLQVEGDEAFQWHAVFMRDLLARKFEGGNAVATTAASGGRRQGGGNDREWVSFGELGRVRRRERFPSLYGVNNRGGEEVLGGGP